MKENNNKGRGVFYGVIGVATLVVAIIGATFAYFTASANAGNGVIGGNMATIGFNLSVEKVVDPGVGSGMIPMSNTMVEAASSKTTGTGTCTDDNGNAVCQIYKITVTNTSTASMFVDGYVALTGGSGIPTDTTLTKNTTNTMRWAQVFSKGTGAGYSTAGVQPLAATSTAGETYTTSTSDPGAIAINSLDAPDSTTPEGTTGMNINNIIKEGPTGGEVTGGTVTISTNPYPAVNKNFIRISDHEVVGEEGQQKTIKVEGSDFTRTNDKTSMLVINQQLSSTGSTGATRDYYFVVWLSETGHNQTPTQSTTNPSATTNPAASNFFNGIVRFISAQGSEVTATFSGYTAVRSDNAATE